MEHDSVGLGPPSFVQGQSPWPLLFEAQITPHRSLSPRGLALILGFLGVVSLSVTTMFWFLGAWPIAGFNGGEMLLAAVSTARARTVPQGARSSAADDAGFAHFAVR